MAKKLAVSEKTIQRLSLYRRLLSQMLHDGAENVYSHELAHVAGGTAAQVRRDMMSLGFSGSPRRGYDSKELILNLQIGTKSPAFRTTVLLLESMF